jgi:UV excision repair protein RAD23
LYICIGKILKDESTMEESGLKNNDFIVLLVNKANRQAPLKKDSTADPIVNATDDVKQALPQKTADTATSKSVSSGSNQTTAGPVASESAFVVGPELEGVVLNLMEMGNFDRELVVKALRAAYNNPDRAAEFLFSGHIPEFTTVSSGRPLSSGRSLIPNSPLAFLRDDPQFQQLRTVIMQNPAMAQPILQQIGSANPRLLQVSRPPYINFSP